MSIRPVEKTDLPELLNLYRHLNPIDDELPSADTIASVWESFTTNPVISCFVAEMDKMLIATCTLAIIPNLTRGCRPYGFIENVVTHEAYRGQGIGKAIIDYALSHAWRARCYKVMLMSNSNRQEAHRFYESCGFRSDQKQAFIIRAKT